MNGSAGHIVTSGEQFHEPVPPDRSVRNNDQTVGNDRPQDTSFYNSTKEPLSPTLNGNGVRNTCPKSPFDDINGQTPRERVQFILGGGGQDGGVLPSCDLEVHDVFSEMEELFYDQDGEVLEWKETARWVKYEENVDLGAGRWSKPHVASLSLHSLLELRKYIKTGSVTLHMYASNLEDIADQIIDSLVSNGSLPLENREKLRETILCRHRQHNQKKPKPEIKPQRRKSSLYPGIDRTLNDSGRSISMGGINNVAMDHEAHHQFKKNYSSSQLNEGRRASKTSLGRNNTSDIFQKEAKAKFLRKIPEGAEASNILVGELDILKKPIMAFVRLAESFVLEDLTEVPIPTRFLFLLLGPPTEDPVQYKEVGRCVATLMTDEVFHELAYKARNREDLLAGIDEFLEQVTVLPPGSWDPSIRIEPPKQVPVQTQRRHSEHFIHPLPQFNEEEDAKFELTRSGRLFGGLFNDIKSKLPFYWSDFRDGFSVQCLASFTFMYIACITPIITFGGLLGAATDDYIAAFESMIGAAICGVIYHMFAGQPLTIIGSTGPILVFETIIYQLCGTLELDFLSFRVWIGFWTCVICIILVATDASALVRYFTRFTEEAFTALIAFIFIYEAFENIIDVEHHYPLQTQVVSRHERGAAAAASDCVCEPGLGSNLTDLSLIDEADCVTIYNGTLVGDGCGPLEPVADVFLLSVILFAATFGMSFTLKMFRFTNFFPTRIRYLISDFGVFTAFIIMTGIDVWLGIPTPKLTVPDQFQPTRSDRGWLVPIFLNPWWSYPAAIIPACLAGILIFMDQQITAVIVNRRENKLKKGFGYHLDLLVIGILIMVMSLVGMPWFVAATVLSLNHVDSLRVMSQTVIPGEVPKVIGCKEQRVTGLMVFILIGASSLLTGVLKYVPMPVLYGIFLYMGVSSLRGVQFFHRLLLYVIPGKHQPDYIYLRHVKLWRVHIFTLIQLICLVLLWVIKTSKASIVFPLMVLAVVFVRKMMDFVFSQQELGFLDDVIPETTKREKDDMKKKKEVLMEEELRTRSGTLTVPLENGQALSFPAEKVIFSPGDGTKDAHLNTSDVLHTLQVPRATKTRARRANSHGLETKDVDDIENKMVGKQNFGMQMDGKFLV